MPSPVGHTIAGIVVNRFTQKSAIVDLAEVALCIFMANAPDLDWVPGIISGRPAQYHQGITHSIGFAILGSVLIAVVLHLMGRPFKRIFLLGFLAYTSHLLLDYFSTDGREPIGIPLLWPISSLAFHSPVPLFLGVKHVSSAQSSIQDLVSGVLNWRNVLTIAVEIALTGPFVLFGSWFAKSRKMRNASESFSGEM